MNRLLDAGNFGGFVATSLGIAAVALLLGSVLNAIWLGVASRWLRIGALRFLPAIYMTFLCNFVFGSFTYLAFLSTVFLSQLQGSGYRYREIGVEYFLMSGLTPVTFAFLAAVAVVGHALLFVHRLPESDGTPLSFQRACTLAMVYLSICSAFLVGLWGFFALSLATVR